jgi:hypothetical protein
VALCERLFVQQGCCIGHGGRWNLPALSAEMIFLRRRDGAERSLGFDMPKNEWSGLLVQTCTRVSIAEVAGGSRREAGHPVADEG